MLKKSMTAFSLLLALTSAPVVFAETHAHWSYSGESAPEKWGKLSQEFATCEHGHNQSPVDIQQAIKGELPPLSLTFHVKDKSIINNGHTLQLNVHDGDSLMLDNTEFDLQQFHFHTPSENRISGKTYPLEVHFVHSDASGQLAVVAVMFEEGAENPVIADILKNVPAAVNVSQSFNKPLALSALMPGDKSYYRYNGSLTTPPCTEGVRWLVMKHPITLSAAQIKTFQKVLGQHNNRPVQPLNSRLIVD